MKFSRRTHWTAESNDLAALLEKKKAASEPLIDLTESNPTRCGFEYLGADLLSALSVHENLKYEPDPKGVLSARKAVAAYYAEKGVTIEPEDVLLVSSTSEAYFYLFKLLLNPGDTIAVPAPGYPLFSYLADLNDAHLASYNLARFPNGLPNDFKAVLVVNPNNPTGFYVSPSEREALNHFCKAHVIPVISDEVFLDYPFKNGGQTMAGNTETLTFALSGISKILGLPQMKLSWIVVSGPKVFKEEALRRLEIIADTFLSVNSPAQNALPGWLAGRARAIGEILARVLRNRSTLSAALKPGVRLLTAEGGWYGVLQSDQFKDEEAFAVRLLHDKNVLVHPGYYYDFEESGHLVVSLLQREPLFKKGLHALLETF